MAMRVQAFTVGMFQTNCYVAFCEKTKEAMIVDPGFAEETEAERIFEFISENDLRPRYIMDTHGHPDHTCGNGLAKERFHVPILIHEYDAYMLGEKGREIARFFGFKNSSAEADRLLRDGELVKIGELTLKVMHTPGHTRGSISLLGEKEGFVGDTLFEDSIGRTDFPEGSEKEMMLSLRKLASLPDTFVVYPGHGSMTTIGREKRNNPFLQ